MKPMTTEDRKVVISVNNVSKKFCRDLKKAYLYGLRDVTAEILGKSRKSNELRSDEFWALRDVTFEIATGESVGIIGVNGSGKSTLIRMIAGLLKPDIGVVKVRGRVIPLSVLGAGFKPNLTGRENVYINMSIFGLSQREIDEKLPEVFDFAEVWYAADAPVRTYSSGMRARLGFACAVFTNPDILLVDEVLAVGDVPFRKKCYRKLSELKEKGVSLVMVSHMSAAILSTCETAIYLAKGKMIMEGASKKVVKTYEEDLSTKDIKNKGDKTETQKEQLKYREKIDNLSKDLQIHSVHLEDDNYNLLETLATGKAANLCIICEAYKELNDVSVNLLISDISDPECPVLLLQIQSENERSFIKISQGKFIIKLFLPYCGLLAGNYLAEINLKQRNDNDYSLLLNVTDFFEFKVKGDENDSNSSFYQPRNWHIEYT